MHFHQHGDGEARAADSGPSLPMPDETSSELRFLDPAAAQFRRGGVRLQFREGTEGDPPSQADAAASAESAWRDVFLVRLFPLGEPDHWVSLIDKDGKEIGILRDAKQLPAGSLGLVHDELRRRYLVPRIERILACGQRHDVVEWTVQTDRGKLKFLTRNLRDQVKEPMPDRLTIVDVEGNRYDLPSLDTLDPDSRRRLEAQL
jgi:hypothetical protein